MTHRPYIETYRRALLDMHVPDTDPGFMAKFDPVALADAYVDAHVDGAMLYCKSHTGLTNWPAPVGKMHANLVGRDILGDTVREFHARDISVCAYHSTSFDDWAWNEHPEWRVETTFPPVVFFGRVGNVCMNNEDYRAYEVAQVADLARRYEWDAFFIDIAHWLGICTCHACRTRYRAEEGNELPDTYDWRSPAWVRFQRARERWSADFLTLMRDTVRAEKPGLPFYANDSVVLWAPFTGRGFDAAQGNSFVGGDKYGKREDQMLGTKVFAAVLPGTKAEFITGRVPHWSEHVDMKSEATMTQRAVAALALDSALLFTDCVNPDGTIDRAMYRRMGVAYAEVEALEPFAGGDHIEQIGVYMSDHAEWDVRTPPGPLDELALQTLRRSPHVLAWLGAVRALQRAHLPFGAITRFGLDDLSRYDVIVLPSLQVMSRREADAFRAYVDAGGRLYASAFTGIVDEQGVAYDEFALSSLFGVRIEQDEEGQMVYIRPGGADVLSDAAAPQELMSHALTGLFDVDPTPTIAPFAIPRLAVETETDTEVLARLTLPYDHPNIGSIEALDWGSIHNNPPWTDTAHPMITQRRVGEGIAVYSAAPLEFREGANERAFIALVRDLLDKPVRVSADAHPTMWIEAYDQPAHDRLMVAAMNYQEDGDPIPVAAEITIAPGDREIARVRRASTGDEVDIHTHADGVSFTTAPITYAEFYLVEYA